MRTCAIIHPLHVELETALLFEGAAKAALYSRIKRPPSIQ